MRKLLLSTVLVMFLLPKIAVAADAASAWVMPAWERLTTTSQPVVDYTGGLALAKGETGSVQIAVKGTSPSYTATWTSPVEFTVNCYAEVWTYTAKTGSAGWYPDGLRPIASGGSVPVAGSRPGALWVDIKVNRDTPAGDYSIPINFARVTKTIPVHVYNWTLPEKPALQSAIGTWPTDSTKTGCRGKLAAELLLLDNRLMATFIDSTHSVQLAAAGQTQAHVGGYCAMSGSTLTGAKPTSAQVDSWVAKYQPLNPYSYVQDEEYSSTVLANLNTWSAALVGKSRRMMTTTITTASAWLDITCALPKFITDDLVAWRIADGKEVWFYQTLSQDSYTPKWLLNRGYAEHVLTSGFLLWRYRLTGLLYWRADYWKNGVDPWTNADGYGSTYPGEALWLLPDGAGYAPTIRLKWMRDGVNTYDALTLLKAQGQGAFADEVTRTVAPDWTGWTRDGAAVEAAKRRLGQKLDELARPKTVIRTDYIVIGVTEYPDEESAIAAATAQVMASGTPVVVTHQIRLELQ